MIKPGIRRMGMVAAGIATVASLSGCPGPGPTSALGITCEGSTGNLAVAPGVDTVSRPNTYTLASPAAPSSCVDRSGTAITSAAIERLSLKFRSIACAVQSGTRGAGSAVVRWSDGTSSGAKVVATLEGALDGNLEMTINSGHFTGWTGATHFIATPTIGDCYSAPITGESAIIEQISLAPPTLGAI